MIMNDDDWQWIIMTDDEWWLLFLSSLDISINIPT